MARIFVSFYNFAYHKKDPYIMPPFYETFVNGLKDAGNDVLYFFEKATSFFGDAIPADVLEKVKKFDPDLFILFNNAFWDITDYFDRPIIVFDVDSVEFFKNKDALLKKNNAYRYITFQESAIPLIRDAFKLNKVDVIKVPLITGIQADPSQEPENNIAFVGWNWLAAKCDYIIDFVKNNNSLEAAAAAKDTVDEFLKHPFLTIEQIYDENKYNTKNILEVGNYRNFMDFLSGVFRARYLTAVADLGLDLRGMSWANDSMKYFPELSLCYNKEQVFSLSENEAFYNNSKIGFNTNHIQAQSGFSWRVCDIMASNACLVSEYRSGLASTFPDIPLPTFTSPAEAREQCQRILKEENLRRDIVAASHEEIEKNHRMKNLLDEMEDFLNIKLNTNSSGSLELWFYCVQSANKQASKKVNVINKIRYKIWKHLNKKLKKDGVI